MLEIIAMNTEDAIAIEYYGGDRIELVSGLTEGGLTPSYGLIEEVIKNVNIPVNVMVRPHANSFIYSDFDLNIMLKDIKIIKELGANGIVFGSLNIDKTINEIMLKKIIGVSKGLDITFHKAFDETNLFESIEILSKYNEITNILTSGGKGNICDNKEILSSLVNLSIKQNILVGGGLNLNNVMDIKTSTKASDYHFGTAVRVDSSPFNKIDGTKVKDILNIINN